jgi:BlaI family penicillinase repressor
MTEKLPNLSKSEWTLMNLCWRLGKSTARQVYEASLKHKKRNYRTVKTLLDRMAVKGYLRVEKLGPLCLFTPAVKRPQVVADAIEDFFDTVLDNTLSPLFVHLTKDRKMSEEEIESLKTLLQEREREEEEGHGGTHR